MPSPPKAKLQPQLLLMVIIGPPPGKFGPALSLQPGKRRRGSARAARASPRAASAHRGDAQRVSLQTRIPPTAGCSAGKQQPSLPRCQHGAEPSPPWLNGNGSPRVAVPVPIPWDMWAGCARSIGKGTAPRCCSGTAERLGSPRGLLAWERQGTAGPNPGQGKRQPERPRRRVLAQGSPKHTSAFSGTPVPFGEVTCSLQSAPPRLQVKSDTAPRGAERLHPAGGLLLLQPWGHSLQSSQGSARKPAAPLPRALQESKTPQHPRIQIGRAHV